MNSNQCFDLMNTHWLLPKKIAGSLSFCGPRSGLVIKFSLAWKWDYAYSYKHATLAVLRCGTRHKLIARSRLYPHNTLPVVTGGQNPQH